MLFNVTQISYVCYNFFVKSYSNNIFGTQALIFILIMLSTLKIQAFNIDRFDQSNAFALGRDLITMPFGMNLLEVNNANADELVIGIHGGISEGYEWIYPLWRLNKEFNQVFFYRWNDKRCANANNAELVNHIDSLIDTYSSIALNDQTPPTNFKEVERLSSASVDTQNQRPLRNTITKDIKIICSLNNSEKKAKSGRTLLFFDIANSPEKPTIKSIGIITIKLFKYREISMI